MEDERPSSHPPTFSDPATWVATHGDFLFRQALLRLRDRGRAEEMVQETFLAALKAREGFAGRSSERTWLVGILKHKIVDHLRKASREVLVAEVERLPYEAEGPFHRDGEWQGHWRPGDGGGPTAWGETPLTNLERKTFREALRLCLEKLPARMAGAFTLREVDGLSGEEVCKALNVTPTNLWVMLHRARTQLRRCLEAHWVGSRDEGG